MSLCPYNRATQSASAMAIPEDPSEPEQVHLRVHRDRRRVEVRAQLGLQTLGQDGGLALRCDRRRGPGRVGAADVRSQGLLRRLQVRRAGRVLPGRQELHEERDTGRPVRHASDHLAELDRESLERVERQFTVDDGAGVLHLHWTQARCCRRSRTRRCNARGTESSRRSASARTCRSSIASSTTTSRMVGGRARSPTRPASRSSRRPTARMTRT